MNTGKTVGVERCKQTQDLEEVELTGLGGWLDRDGEGEVVVVKDEARLLALALNGSWLPVEGCWLYNMPPNSLQSSKSLSMKHQDCHSWEAGCVGWSLSLGSHSQGPLQGWANGTRRYKEAQAWGWFYKLGKAGQTGSLKRGSGWHLRWGELSQHVRWFSKSRCSRRPGQARTQENVRAWWWGGHPFLQPAKEGLGGTRELVSTELLLHGSHCDNFHSTILLLRKAGFWEVKWPVQGHIDSMCRARTWT